MAYTLGGASLGTVTSEKSKLDAQLFQMPLPLSPSNDLIALDLFGAMRTIDIEGTWTTANGVIATFITFIDGLISGNQSTIIYHSDTSGINYNVLVQTVDWHQDPAQTTSIYYSISMLEAESV